MKTPIVLFNPIMHKAKAFESIASAARYLKLDESTVRRAVTGARGRISAGGYLAIAVTPETTKRKAKA
jgi:hypothetical protein